MRTYTAHLRVDRSPVLIREGWSWWAAIFGPFWLLAQRAWVPGVLFLALTLVVGQLAPERLQGVLALAFAVLAGLLGHDVVRWTLERRGYVMAHVLAARDEEGALARLLTARPDLAAQYADTLR